MAYQVLARKYRPQRFEDVVGQDHVTDTLRNAIQQGRIAHAYLFCGPRGTGKTTIARIFAKCLNCTGGPRLDFADDDPRCLEITEGRSLDVLEIDGASNRGIDEIRALRDTVKYAPAAARFKVYIIDEVHMLTKEAFNALLKTLEEPPAHVKFMFATTEPEKVLPTILSRCQRFDLRRIPAALIVKHLAQIARQEQTKIDDAALYAIARGADGGMRDAESTLDQLISFCGDHIQEADVLSMFGLAGQDQVRALFQAILNSDAAGALRSLDDLCRNGKDLGRLLGDLLAHGRYLLLTLISGDQPAFDELPEAELVALRNEAATVEFAELARVMDVLAASERHLRDAASRRIVFEISLLKAMEARRAVPIQALLQQLQQLRSASTDSEPNHPAASDSQRPPRATSPAPSPSGLGRRPPVTTEKRPDLPHPAPLEPGHQPTAHPHPQPPPGPPKEPPATEPTPSIIGTDQQDSLARAWHALMSNLSSSHRFLQTYLTQARPLGLDRGVLTIGWGPEFADQVELVNTDRNRQVIQQRLIELGLDVAKVRFVQTDVSLESPAPPVAQPDPPRSPAESHEPAPTPQPVMPPLSPSPAPPPVSPTPGQVPPPKAAAPAPLDKDDFKNDPMIRKALEIFRGQIAEVRG